MTEKERRQERKKERKKEKNTERKKKIQRENTLKSSHLCLLIIVRKLTYTRIGFVSLI